MSAASTRAAEKASVLRSPHWSATASSVGKKGAETSLDMSSAATPFRYVGTAASLTYSTTPSMMVLTEPATT